MNKSCRDQAKNTKSGPFTAMQAGIDALGQTTIDTLDLHQFFDASALDAGQTAECLEQRRATACTDARHVFQHAALAGLFAPLAMTADGETVGLVAHRRHQMQRRR
jgi:hypothetical protein